MVHAGLNLTIKEENFKSFATLWREYRPYFRRSPFFMLPDWLEVWWNTFNPGGELFIRSFWEKESLCGIAPLYIEGNTAFFLGSNDLFDYRDFLIYTGREQNFFSALVKDLQEKGVKKLVLQLLKTDSTVFNYLLPQLKREKKDEVISTSEDALFEMEIPGDWEIYLQSLSKKQRHEIRRKLRRLYEIGDVNYRELKDIDEIFPDRLQTFFDMFVQSREDKAEFLTSKRKIFLHNIFNRMAWNGHLRMGCLEINGVTAGMTIHFVYDGQVYLYNSARNNDYVSLSTGYMTKVLGIKESIEKQCKHFNFLKGKEAYKSRLGGKEVSLYRCEIKLT